MRFRWSITHLGNASDRTLHRMKAMNVGWTTQRPNAASVARAKELGVPMADQIGGIESVLTMVGGRIVYAVGPYAALR